MLPKEERVHDFEGSAEADALSKGNSSEDRAYIPVHRRRLALGRLTTG
jgi:hypothetical protein